LVLVWIGEPTEAAREAGRERDEDETIGVLKGLFLLFAASRRLLRGTVCGC